MLVADGVTHDSRVLKSARTIADAGYAVTVLGTGDAGSGWRDEGGFDVRIAVVPRPGRLAFRRGPRELQRLDTHRSAWQPLVRELAPDLLHVHDSDGLALASAAKVPWIFDAHEDPLARRFDDPRRREAVRRALVRHVRGAAGVITVSRPLAERLTAELELARPPVLVHNAPALAWAEPPAPGLRERAGVAADAPLVVYAGTLTNRRRLTVVLEALALLPAVELALVVPAEHKRLPALLARAEELGVRDRVHVTGLVPADAVVPFIAGADVGVHPLERYDNGDVALPNKLFEYLHAGLPMVVSDTPAMAGFVREHDLGEVAPVDDARAWATGIERALAHGRTGGEALRAEWSWEAQAEKLVELYAAVSARR